MKKLAGILVLLVGTGFFLGVIKNPITPPSTTYILAVAGWNLSILVCAFWALLREIKRQNLQLGGG